MPDIKRYKSVAVPIHTWKKLWKLADKNQRSPAQQISFLVEIAQTAPTDAEFRVLFSDVEKNRKKK